MRPLAARPDAGAAQPKPSWWRLSNWRLRRKMLIVLLIPLATAVALGALRVVGQLQDANVYDKLNEQVELSDSLSDVMNNVERERQQSVLFVASRGQVPNDAEVADRVDASVAAFQRRVEAADDLDSRSQTLLTDASSALSDLSAVRGAVAQSNYPEISVLGVYNRIMATLLQSSQLISASAPDSRITQLATNLGSLRSAKDELSQVNAVLMATVAPGRQDDGTYVIGTEEVLDNAKAEYQAAVSAFTVSATPANRQIYLDTVTGPAVDQRAQLQSLIEARTNAGESAPVTAERVRQAGDDTGELIRTAEKRLNTQLHDLTSSLASSAQTQALRDGGIVLIALFLAFLIALLVARSLVRSLRKLRVGALDVATTRLPQSIERILADPDPIQASSKAVEPLPVFTTEEVGQVARSFDTVHEQAIRLASEQALLRDNVNAMLVNLSRRSQALVERQLGLIDRLESDEQDPDQLASLFELDHLATRMRRNSENLLVLSGTELGRRLSKPVPFSDVIGAAVSETDQYARVDVRPAPQAAVAGPAVNDVVHLIAELLDNATAYSSPETQVTVRSATGRKGTLAVEVIDRGVGVDEVELARLNERLTNPPDLDVSVSRRMGLYVVATLARRHAIQVQLRENLEIEGGVVAKVVLPANLVAELAGVQVEAPRERSQPSMPGGQGTGYFPSTSTGGFPPVGADDADRGSPAMTSSGIAGAFGFGATSGNNGTATSNGTGNGSATGRQESGQESLPRRSNGRAHQDHRPETAQPENGYDGFRGFGDVDAAPTDTDGQEQTPGGIAEQLRGAEAPAAKQPPQAPDAGERSNEYSLNGTNSQVSDVDVPTDRLPIYEEVLSQWFSTPAGGTSDAAQGDTSAPAEQAPAEDTAAEPAPPSTGLPKRVPGSKSAELPKRPAPTPAPEPAPAAAAVPQDEWSSPADGGWQAAQALLQPVDEMTKAGLPKRRPKAHLVPGSAALSATPTTTVAQTASGVAVAVPPMVPRSADAVRGRMSSLQQGVARGRHALIEAGPEGAPNPADDGNTGHRERQ